MFMMRLIASLLLFLNMQLPLRAAAFLSYGELEKQQKVMMEKTKKFGEAGIDKVNAIKDQKELASKTPEEQKKAHKDSAKQAGMMAVMMAAGQTLQVLSKKNEKQKGSYSKTSTVSGENSVTADPLKKSNKGIMVVGNEQQKRNGVVASDPYLDSLLVKDAEYYQEQEQDAPELEDAEELEEYGDMDAFDDGSSDYPDDQAEGNSDASDDEYHYDTSSEAYESQQEEPEQDGYKG